MEQSLRYGLILLNGAKCVTSFADASHIMQMIIICVASKNTCTVDDLQILKRTFYNAEQSNQGQELVHIISLPSPINSSPSIIPKIILINLSSIRVMMGYFLSVEIIFEFDPQIDLNQEFTMPGSRKLTERCIELGHNLVKSYYS